MNDKKDFLLLEYDKLKEEQCVRIGFRDNMIYLTLGVIGAVLSFSAGTSIQNIAYLILPFACTVLGWTYFTNDRAISGIGKYIRTELIPQLGDDMNWETYHKQLPNRDAVKKFQLIIDLGLFCLPSMFSLTAFLMVEDKLNSIYIAAILLESAMVAFLTYQFVIASNIFSKTTRS